MIAGGTCISLARRCRFQAGFTENRLAVDFDRTQIDEPAHSRPRRLAGERLSCDFHPAIFVKRIRRRFTSDVRSRGEMNSAGHALQS